MRRGLFIDKDGTLVRDVPFNVRPEAIDLDPGAAELFRLVRAGFLVVVVSNQPGIGLGMFGERELDLVRSRLDDLLRIHSVKLSGFYYCPHAPSESGLGCECRKPKPGLLRKAASDLEIDLSSSWMIGDILDDVEAGNRAGCATVLIDNGNETEWRPGRFRRPCAVCRSLRDALRYVAGLARDEVAP